MINVNQIVAVTYNYGENALYVERGGHGNYTLLTVKNGTSPTEAINNFQRWIKQQCKAQQ